MNRSTFGSTKFNTSLGPSQSRENIKGSSGLTVTQALTRAKEALGVLMDTGAAQSARADELREEIEILMRIRTQGA